MYANMDFQKYSDAFLAKTLLPFIPHSISPNQVSWARIVSLPFIYYLLSSEQYAWGLALFALAALTDALDGAMARVRDRITETGKILDAVADRGLIILVAVLLIPANFGWWLLIAIGLLEALNGIMAHRSKKRIGMNPGANWAGKVKMLIQCIAFGMMFAALLSGDLVWNAYAYPLLVLSLLFALMQSFLYPQTAAETTTR